MKSLSGNTVLVTGGSSGIGAALAQAFHAKGNKVIITGRRKSLLDQVASGHPGMLAYEIDMMDGKSLKAFAGQITKEVPSLNVVINNAGIMKQEDIKSAPANLPLAEAIITTNLLAPLQLTSLLLPHLRQKDHASVMMVTSGLAFVPYVANPSYSATKAGLHAWCMAAREQLRGTNVAVTEIAPPYVQTELNGTFQATDPNAMPLTDFVAEVMALLAADPSRAEVIVERCKMLRTAGQAGNFETVFARINGLK